LRYAEVSPALSIYDKLSPEERAAALRDDRYPRSAKYDPDWLWANQMGSHCLWLVEALTNRMDLKPGQRVLNLGCGKAVESIFLAREFGCQVWAVDLTVSATENLSRIREAGVGDLVFPLQADARSLPFAEGFFDATVSVNAYWFVGTDDLYLPGRFARLFRPGAEIGMIVPGLVREIKGEVPEHLREPWVDHFIAYHSPAWWKRHLERSGQVKIGVADTLGDGEGSRVFRHWDWLNNGEEGVAVKDDGRHLTFVRLVGRRL